METLLLCRQLQDQLSQWVQPKDQRHLQGFAEIMAAVLQSGEACLGRWIPYLSHQDCQARAHMERLSYFLHNQQVAAERYYESMLRKVLSALTGEAILLALDTSMQPAERLWRLADEPLVNRCFDALRDLEDVLEARCRTLLSMQSEIKALTNYHWWPA